MVNSRTAQLDDTFYALSDPTRRAIIGHLAGGDATVGELSAPFSISPSAMTKHLRVLERVGLIAQHREGRNRRCTLRREPLTEAADYFRDYEHFWQDRLDGLASYADEHKRRS